MKKLIVCLLLVCSPALAASEFKIGTEVSNITYKEPRRMEESGIMYGVVGSVEYLERWFARVEGKYAWGTMDYSSPRSGTVNDIDDTLIEARALIGHTCPLGFIPYSGVGYRYLKDAVGGKTSSKGFFGFDRESNYIYAPLGVEFRKDLGSWDVRLNGELDVFLTGRQINHTSVIPGLNDFTNKQSTGLGQRVSLNLTKDIGKINVSAGPYFRHWDIRGSKTAEVVPGVLFYEPRNNSTEIGINFSIKF